MTKIYSHGDCEYYIEKYDECKSSVKLAKEIVAFEEKNIEKMKEFL